MVIPLEIPDHIPKPDMSLLKVEDPTTGNIETNAEPTTEKTPPRDNLWKHFLNFQPVGSEDDQIISEGTISGFLPATKHNMSPSENSQEHKKKKIEPEEQIINELEDLEIEGQEEEDITEDIEENITEDNTDKPIRTPSINKLLNNLPEGIVIKNTNQGQTNNHDG